MKSNFRKLFVGSMIIASFFLISFSSNDLSVAKMVTGTATTTPTLIASSTPIPTNSSDAQRISGLETQVAELEKEIEEPLMSDMISAVGTLIGGIAVALIGFYGSREYKRRKAAVDERNSEINKYKVELIKSDIIRNFIPYLTPQKSKQRKIIMQAISKFDNQWADEIDGILNSVEQVPEQQESQPISTKKQVGKRRNK